MTIRKTTNYDSFKFVLGNRIIHESHVKNLMQSISAHNLLEQNPILVNQHSEVIDGQHRLEAAKRLGVPVYYVVLDQGNIDDVTRLNANNRSWVTGDFLERYVKTGNEHYVLLKDFSTNYGISISISIDLLTGFNLRRPEGLLKEFKDGKFKITHLKEAIDIADRLASVQPYCEPSVAHHREFVGALLKAHKTVKPTELLEKIKLYCDAKDYKIKRRPSQKEYLRDLEDIYNWKRPEGYRVRLYE